MSFSFSKLFGGGKKDHAALAIHDGFLEALYVRQKGKEKELVGVNHVDLEPGIIEKGAIKNESKFQEALETLLMEAEPNPIQLKKLFINIPFEQVYPFVKVFSKHAKEDHMKESMEDLVRTHAPFSLEELEVDYKKQSGDKIVYGALACAKAWRGMVKEACSELGFSDLHFYPEPLAHLGLSKLFISGNFSLLSWHNGQVFASLFYDNLLYDTFPLKADAEDPKTLVDDYQKSNQDFKENFNSEIQDIYLSGFPSDLRKKLMSALSKEGLNPTFLSENDTHVADLVPMDKYSPALVGLAMRSLMKK